MSRKLASIEKITKLEPIKDKDRIELATILGWNVIVGKGDFKVGDLVVYVEYDTMLPPKPEFEFLRPRCYSPKYDGFRIRSMKMAGVFSEGIVFSSDILFPHVPIKGGIKEGVAVADVLGVQRYDPEELKEAELAKQSKNPLYKYFMRFKWFRKLVMNHKPKRDYPEYIKKSDENNIQVKFNKLKHQDDTYYVTEKLEGQSASNEVNKKGKFHVYSHNVKLPKQKVPSGNWWRIALQFDIESRMKAFMKDNNIKSLAIQGEIIGEGIQKNIYKIKGLDFYIFNIRDTDKKEDFPIAFIQEFCKATGIKHVPLIKEMAMLPDTVEEVIKEADGMSILNPKQIREGLVWRSYNSNPKVSFKAKSEKYKIWWDKKDVTE